MAEIVIKGGTVLDGTGGPPRRADVAISAGRIVEIGERLRGDVELDATGQYVSPGFIDIHTHYDAQVFWDPALSPSCYHGVTTVVAGNCGFSLAPTRPEHRDNVLGILENVEDMNRASLDEGVVWDFETFPEYLASIERRGLLLNFGAFIGHTPLRLFVMGNDFERAATAQEIDQMRAVVRDAMQAGAAGFASSFGVLHQDSKGRKVPSRHADAAEMAALFGVLGEEHRGVVSISPGGPCSHDDLYALQPTIGVPFTYGALLSDPEGDFRRRVDLNSRGWTDGVQVWPQVTSRPVTVEFTMAHGGLLAANSEFRALMGSSIETRRSAYADPTWRERTIDAFAQQRSLRPRWDTYVITRCDHEPALLGRHLAAVAAERATSPFEAALDLAQAEEGLALTLHGVVSNDDPAAVAELLLDEHCTLGLSDAGAHVSQLCDASQATDFLGEWVRGREVMSWTSAVRKLTGVQADLMGFADRGYLRQGAWADVVVFDPATVGPGAVRRVRDFPGNAERLTADAPTGVTHVVVNGTPIRRDGAMVASALDTRPGRVV
ncbi:MAG: amidohydrolase family protein, partial [Acidimicrobiales bacterium]